MVAMQIHDRKERRQYDRVLYTLELGWRYGPEPREKEHRKAIDGYAAVLILSIMYILDYQEGNWLATAESLQRRNGTGVPCGDNVLRQGPEVWAIIFPL